MSFAMSSATLLAGLATACAGACVASAFTAWGRRRPLHRYGALSVAAHLTLLAALATIRTDGPPSPGGTNGPPVRVAIVLKTTTPEVKKQPEVPAGAARTPTEPSPIERPPADTGAARTDAPAEPVAPPPPAPAIDPPTPQADALAPPEDGGVTWSLGSDSPPAEPVPPSPAPAGSPVAAPATETVEVPSPTPAAPPSQPPSAYARRGDAQRRRVSANEGGAAESPDAVASAVDWLARAQRADGAWDSAQWGAGRETLTLGHDRQGAGAGAETGLTGLALLAMGGAGHTHLAGPYQDSVTLGLQHLLDRQAQDGSLYGDATLYARTYCHSIATFALAEAMAVTGDQRLRPAVEAAVGFLERTQNQAAGGWRYTPGDRGDTSQMGWVVMALRSAELAGVPVRESTWDRCDRFLATVRRGRAGGLAAYQPQAPTSSTMTAEAMYCRQVLGVEPRTSPAFAEATAALLADLPGAPPRSGGRPRTNLYYWYYATLALHHQESAGPDARAAWSDWNTALRRAVMSKQVADGPLAGSWDPDTVWGGYGGRVYTTALAAMCLEVDYRYNADLIGRDARLAARPGVLAR